MKKQIRALLNPIHFPGFHTLLRGEVCEVPEGYEDGCQGHVDRGTAEWVTDEPFPDPASADIKSGQALELQRAAEVVSPPAGEPPEQLEARLRAELAALEAEDGEIDVDATLAAGSTESEHPTTTDARPRAGKPVVPCVHCGKIYTDHAKKTSAAKPGLACEGLRRGFAPPAPAT